MAAASLAAAAWLLPAAPCRSQQLSTDSLHPRFHPTGACRNAFVAARPPGHHAGGGGLALDAPSQGFCLLNHVAIGARYALQTHTSLQRVAILDFDVRHTRQHCTESMHATLNATRSRHMNTPHEHAHACISCTARPVIDQTEGTFPLDQTYYDSTSTSSRMHPSIQACRQRPAGEIDC